MLKHSEPGFSQEELCTLFAPVADMKRIGLSVSGGADSLALMVLVHRWLNGLSKGPNVIIYSVDHGLRKESASECKTVQTIANTFGFVTRVLVWRGEKPKTGIQAAARHGRYFLMGAAMKEDNVDILLTGHHGDDQAETLMMRLAHSSGLAGLRGMDDFSTIMGTPVFRPFLTVAQTRLLEVVATVQLDVAHDPSNEDPKYERVRWRKLMGELDQMGLTTPVLMKFAQRMGRANVALEEFAQQAYAQIVKIDHFGVTFVPIEAFINLEEEIGIRVLSRMIFMGSGGRSKGELGQLEAIVGMLWGKDFKGVSIGGCIVDKHQAMLVVFREASRVDEGVVQLAPFEEVVWDQRFTLKNKTDNPVEIKLAEKITRDQAEKLLGDKIDVPIAGLRAMPTIIDRQNNVLAIGTHKVAQGLICDLIWHAYGDK